MNLGFSIKEGLKGLKRARMATAITITSVTVALMMIGLFIIVSVNIDHWVGEKRKNIEIEAFFEPVLNNSTAKKLVNKIRQMDGVERVDYISKEAAALRFKKEFGRDVVEVLGTNPLPPSCVIHLKSTHRNALAIANLSHKIKKLDGITDVVYAQGFLQLIDRYVTIIYLIIGGLGLLLLIVAIILIHNSIRLIIYARREIIEIMELVGAKKSFIRRPFLVEGIFYGIMGGILANAFIFALIQIVRRWLYSGVIEAPEIYGLILGLGVFIGFVSSQISLNKHLNKLI